MIIPGSAESLLYTTDQSIGNYMAQKAHTQTKASYKLNLELIVGRSKIAIGRQIFDN